MLQAAVSSMHLACDAWTSPNHRALFAIVAHFTSEESRLQSMLLSLQEPIGQHTGENLSCVVLTMLNEYNIRNRLGHFVMDNASNNDTMMEYISADLEADGIDYSPHKNCLRCNGHIVNLAFQAFLFGKHPDIQAHADRDESSRSGSAQRELNTWRKLGPLGKLHNIITHIMASTQRIKYPCVVDSC